MIIKAFATHLQSLENDEPSIASLSTWVKKILESKPENNVERIIHHEIELSKNNLGVFVLIGKSESGRILIDSLYNFALSYDQQRFSRWVHSSKPSDFNKNNTL